LFRSAATKRKVEDEWTKMRLSQDAVQGHDSDSHEHNLVAWDLDYKLLLLFPLNKKSM